VFAAAKGLSLNLLPCTKSGATIQHATPLLALAAETPDVEAVEKVHLGLGI
jgi:hypothetical protein